MWLPEPYKVLCMRNFAAASNMDDGENIRKHKKKKAEQIIQLMIA